MATTKTTLLNFSLLLVVAAFLGACSEEAEQPVQVADGPAVIYGQDDRWEANQMNHPLLKEISRSVVAIFDSASLIPVSPVAMQVQARPFGHIEALNLCPDERFFHQLSASECSGSLIAPQIVLTAGHCVQKASSCKRQRYVFDYDAVNGYAPQFVKSDNVYRCKRILGSKVEFFGADWALIELDRPVTDRLPVRLGDSDQIQKGHPVFVVGFPVGVPKKITMGGKVRLKTESHFIANVDTYAGNSGSPVFSRLDGRQIGILARGDTDFVEDLKRNCRTSNRCIEEGCQGEDITLINLPKEYLKNSL